MGGYGNTIAHELFSFDTSMYIGPLSNYPSLRAMAMRVNNNKNKKREPNTANVLNWFGSPNALRPPTINSSVFNTILIERGPGEKSFIKQCRNISTSTVVNYV